mmetsp:Transcript_26291/g.38849  ORF Transcript_26291/g.38849 Transcript_26291/m.38849 type:complete len:245 (+) Transcript_26291:141-875(+)
MEHLSVLKYFLLAFLFCHHVVAFSPPSLGLGALIFRPAGMKTRPALMDDATLRQAADFFTDAFWANKVGGGIKELQSKQRKSLLGSQTTEFRKRYGGKYGGDRISELLVCRNDKDEVMGCCGIEVDNIFGNGLKSNILKQAPLMSNLAVGREFRRRGIAEELVNEAEELARKKWGYDEVYLYVEKRNKAAVRLYQKLGYRKVWEDESASTLLPLKTGSMRQVSTTLLCMKKRLGLGIFGRLLPF